MTHKIVAVDSYEFTEQDQLFLDANIWLYLYGPQSPKASRGVKIYSRIFRRILKAESRIYIDVLVISEFINSYARIRWRNVAPLMEFKKFCNSSSFKSVAQDIAADAKRVLKHCSQVESGFGILKMSDLLCNYATSGADFNDAIIAELCKRKEMKLITNDGDFRGLGAAVLTANKHLLQKC